MDTREVDVEQEKSSTCNVWNNTWGSMLHAV